MLVDRDPWLSMSVPRGRLDVRTAKAATHSERRGALEWLSRRLTRPLPRPAGAVRRDTEQTERPATTVRRDTEQTEPLAA